MLQVQYNINNPKFTGRNVPIAEYDCSRCRIC